MSDIEKVVDKFSGFITKEQAEALLNSDSEFEPDPIAKSKKESTNVKKLLEKLASLPKSAGQKKPDYLLVNVKDSIYRIFNPVTLNIKGSNLVRRTMVLGEEGFTINLSLKDKHSEFIDINVLERGDTVIINNALFDPSTGELRTGQATSISRTVPSKSAAIVNYSTIIAESKRVDLIGRVVEVGPIRYVSKLGKSGELAVASCVLTDSTNLIDATLWGSSASSTARMKPNDFIKIEFCDVRNRDGKFQVYANDDSRVAISQTFSDKLGSK